MGSERGSMDNMEENTVRSEIGIRVVTGQNADPVLVTLSDSHEKMAVIIEGYADEKGVEHVNITASGPQATLQGLQELGEILVGIGNAVRSEAMAKAATGGTGGE